MFLFKAKSIIFGEQRTGSETAGILHTHTRPIIRSLSSQSLSSLLYNIFIYILYYIMYTTTTTPTTLWVCMRVRERET